MTDSWDITFDTLLRSQHETVRDVLAGMGVPWATVDDLAQEAFLILYRQGRDLAPGSDHRAWLIGVARNLARSEYRRRGRSERVVRQLEDFDRITAREREEEPDAQRGIAALRACLETVPTDQRRLLERYYQGEASEALAHELGRSVNALRKGLLRLRERLRDCVARRLQADGGGR